MIKAKPWMILAAVAAIFFAIQTRRLSAQAKAQQAGTIEVTNSEKQLSITAVTPPVASHSITFNNSSSHRVILHADGRVEWDGDLDTATLLFWTRVSQVFPGFKKSICGKVSE